ncbi:LOW QUALITY PROTEIN: hypothetical protein KUTeg_023836, partial [Tegillarca granosa]
MGLRGDGLVIGHGQFDPNIILVKRTSSDQRISELQALIALARRRGGVAVAHGKIDPLLMYMIVYVSVKKSSTGIRNYPHRTFRNILLP